LKNTVLASSLISTQCSWLGYFQTILWSRSSSLTSYIVLILMKKPKKVLFKSVSNLVKFKI